MPSAKREPRTYRLYRAIRGQPWIRVEWPARYSREAGQWLVRPLRQPYAYDWGELSDASVRLATMLLKHSLRSTALAGALAPTFAAEVLERLPYSGYRLTLGRIYEFLAARDKCLVDELLAYDHYSYADDGPIDFLDGPHRPPSTLIV